MGSTIGSVGAVYVGEPGDWLALGHLTSNLGFEKTEIHTLETAGTDKPVRTYTKAAITFDFELAEVDNELLALMVGEHLWTRIWFERDGGDPLELGYIEHAYEVDPEEIAEAIREGLREVYG